VQIRTRLTVQFTLWVTGIISVAFLAIYTQMQLVTHEDFRERLRKKAITSAVLLLKVEEVDSVLLRTIDLAKRDLLHHENISILNEYREEIYTNNDKIHFKLGPDFFQQVENEGGATRQQGDFDVIGVPFHDRGKHYTLVAGAVNEDGEERLRSLRVTLVALGAGMVLIIALAGWIYAGRALRPIQKMIRDLQQISPSELTSRLETPRHLDEIGRLTTIINDLLTRIERAFETEKQFVSNVSHELKNPLTKITSQLEVTLLRPRPPEEYQKLLESLLEDTRDLNQLANSLLELARLSAVRNGQPMETVRLDEVLWDARDHVLKINEHFHVTVVPLQLPDEAVHLELPGHGHLLRLALQNIIENACKFSPDHTARIELNREPGAFVILVSDRGPGIPPEDLANILNPFFRSNATSQTKGHGIGLSLVSRIVALHGGTIHFEQRQPGTCVRITIPQQAF